MNYAGLIRSYTKVEPRDMDRASLARQIQPNQTAFYGLPTTLPERGGLLGSNRAVTSCKLPLQAVGRVALKHSH